MGNGSADFDRGRHIGKYEILTRLSVGGMAELFLAYLPGPGGFKKFVALKQILPDVKADDAFVKMFLDEARITAAFNNSNIGQVFDLGEDPDSGELYLAMEFIAGQNLEQLIKRAAKNAVAIPVGFAVRVVRDAALGLHYAHTFKDPTGTPMSVVHRDVSPKNVMITYTGQVKMIDFGIAKARGRLNRTQVGIVKGTSGYMSPEQVRNEELDGRTDLFAAGVMLHEMLCGERLFTANTDASMMIKIVEEPAKDPTSVNQWVSPELAQVVLKVLEKDRNRRFPNGKEFARALEQACPDLFDDEQVAEFMGQLFDDKIALTRSLLEAANQNQDKASMTNAVQRLTTEEENLRRTGGMQARSSATPAPRPAARAAASSQRLPKVSSGAVKVPKPAPPPPANRSQRGLPKVPSRPLPEPEGDAEATIPPVSRARQSSMKLKPVDESAPTPPRPKTEAKAAAPKPSKSPEVPAEPKKKGGGGVLVLLTVIAIFGGLGWAITAGPLKDRAKAVIKQQTDDEPVVDTGPKKLDTAAPAKGPKPQWLIDKERQDAELAAEKARQKEVEDANNDPERQKMLAEIQAQLQQLNSLEEEQRKLKEEAKESKSSSAANTKKIDDLQKQIDDLKGMLKTKNAGTARAPGPGSTTNPKPVDPNAPVTIVRDQRTAKAAEVGYLSLHTSNPSSAAVFLDTTELGSTPLIKVPIEAGTHHLRIVDTESKNRTLTVTIEAGKTLQLPQIDVTSLQLMP